MKHRMVEILAKMAYWAGVDAIFCWVNRRAKRIVTFHNVLPDLMFTGLGELPWPVRVSYKSGETAF